MAGNGIAGDLDCGPQARPPDLRIGRAQYRLLEQLVPIQDVSPLILRPKARPPDLRFRLKREQLKWF